MTDLQFEQLYTLHLVIGLCICVGLGVIAGGQR
ncbi:tail virion protein G7P-2 [Vibrio vulnificus]